MPKTYYVINIVQGPNVPKNLSVTYAIKLFVLSKLLPYNLERVSNFFFIYQGLEDKSQIATIVSHVVGVYLESVNSNKFPQNDALIRILCEEVKIVVIIFRSGKI